MSEGKAEKRDETPKVDLWASSRKLRIPQANALSAPTGGAHSDPAVEPSIEQVVERQNMFRALEAVVRNKGAAGVDGMTVQQLRDYLKIHWPRIKGLLLEGKYLPQPVRKVEIPKPGGKGMRMLGIPTVVDRMIQQAIHQVLSPIWEKEFSAHSYGFRPKRGAHQAVKAARDYVGQGKRWVVDMDLEKFFDRVNHDILMSRIARKVKDRRLLLLIRRYLQSGIMEGGIVAPRTEGTPQGGPMSPLLSNILLDDLDKELERRGHQFCRYADDCNIYVKSKRAGERVLDSITKYLAETLRLKVNLEKSKVDRPWNRKFLGYSMTFHMKPKLKVAETSVERLKAGVKKLFGSARGKNLDRFIKEELTPKLRGWAAYFFWSETKGIFEELDGWIRRKLRCARWRQWKRGRTRYKKLVALGFTQAKAKVCAWNGKGPWWNGGASHMSAAFPKKYFDRKGLLSLVDEVAWLNAVKQASSL
jgi:RNA-directed DNA polymerase